MDDAEVLNRPGHGDVEEPQASGSVAGDRRRLHHDDGVELEALGGGRRHNGDGASSSRRALRRPTPVVSPASVAKGHLVRGGDEPPPCHSAPQRPGLGNESASSRSVVAKRRCGSERPVRIDVVAVTLGAATGKSREAKSSTLPGAR